MGTASGESDVYFGVEVGKWGAEGAAIFCFVWPAEGGIFFFFYRMCQCSKCSDFGEEFKYE